MINAISHNDVLAQLALVLLTFILTHRVTSQPSQPRHVFWFAGAVTLFPVVFLATREPAVAVNPYVSTFALLSAGLFAAGFVSALDRTGRAAAYFVTYVLALAVVYSYSLHYGPLHTKVLGVPAFFAVAVPSLALLVCLPVKAWLAKKTNAHSLWLTLGFMVMALAGYLMWGVTAGRVVIAEDYVNPVIYTVLFVGLLFVLLGFVLAKEWLAGERPLDRPA